MDLGRPPAGPGRRRPSGSAALLAPYAVPGLARWRCAVGRGGRCRRRRRGDAAAAGAAARRASSASSRRSRSPAVTAAVRGAAREASPLRALADVGRLGRGRPRPGRRPAPAARRRAPRFIADATVTALVDGARTPPARRPGPAVRAGGGVGRTCCPGRRCAPGSGVRAAGAGRRRGRRARRPGAADSRRRPAAGCSAPPGRCGTGSPPRPRRVLDARPAGLLPGPGRRRHPRHGPGAGRRLPAGRPDAPHRRVRRQRRDRAGRRALAAAAAGGRPAGAGRRGRARARRLRRPRPARARASSGRPPWAAVTLLALASGRSAGGRARRWPRPCACCCSLDPGLARDAGFALSVAATAAIVLLAPGWSRRLRGARLAAGRSPTRSPSAPPPAWPPRRSSPALSGTVSLVSLPANLLAAPAVAPATVLGLLAAVVGAARARRWPTRSSGSPAGRCAGWCWSPSEPRRCRTRRPAGRPAPAARCCSPACCSPARRGRCWRFPRLRPLALAALVGLVVLGWPLRQTVRGWPPADTVAVACDVGQGDALVLPDRARGGGARRRRPRRRRRSTGAWTGWASTRCRWSCSRTWTPTTSAVWPARWPAADVGVVATGTLVAGRRPGRRPRPARRAAPARAGRCSCPATGARVGAVDVEVLAPDPGPGDGGGRAQRPVDGRPG